MLYLLRSDGTVEQCPHATESVLDEATGDLLCIDESGRIIARYPKLTVIAFSAMPFPEFETGDGNRAGKGNT